MGTQEDSGVRHFCVSNRIACFDIELSHRYRDGTRGKSGAPRYTATTSMSYNPDVVVKRDQQGLPFFRKENGISNGKFANIAITSAVPRPQTSDGNRSLPNTIPFYDFLQIYYQEREKWERLQ